jgi:hypothetical protein
MIVALLVLGFRRSGPIGMIYMRFRLHQVRVTEFVVGHGTLVP